jgi:flagellar protein FliL
MADAKKEGGVNASLDDDTSVDKEEEGGGKKKLVIIIIAAVVLLGGAGAGLYFSGMLDKFLKKGEVTEEAQAEGEGEHAAKDEAHGEEAKKEDGHGGKEGEGQGTGPYFLKIQDMTVNLYSEDGTPQFLRLSVQLELNSEADVAAVEKVMPRVVDQFQLYLRELRVRDLRGSAGLYRLQIELLGRVNQAAYPTEVQSVLLQEILVQ